MAFRSSILIHFCFLLTVLAFNNTVYVISNAETPSFGLPGLTPIGVQRAQTCIPAVRMKNQWYTNSYILQREHWFSCLQAWTSAKSSHARPMLIVELVSLLLRPPNPWPAHLTWLSIYRGMFLSNHIDAWDLAKSFPRSQWRRWRDRRRLCDETDEEVCRNEYTVDRGCLGLRFFTQSLHWELIKFGRI